MELSVNFHTFHIRLNPICASARMGFSHCSLYLIANSKNSCEKFTLSIPKENYTNELHSNNRRRIFFAEFFFREHFRNGENRLVARQ